MKQKSYPMLQLEPRGALFSFTRLNLIPNPTPPPKGAQTGSSCFQVENWVQVSSGLLIKIWPIFLSVIAQYVPIDLGGVKSNFGLSISKFQIRVVSDLPYPIKDVKFINRLLEIRLSANKHLVVWLR